jgi:L-alanine-DL-glutamate epimerase-like enolase superfamily enzyme
VRITVTKETLRLAETFTIARGSVDEDTVVQVRLEHDGVVGYGEGAPVDFWGETPDSMVAFLEQEAPALLGDDPLDREAIAARLAARRGEQGAKMALDGALYDWLGKRAGLPVWRLLGTADRTPPTSYTIGIDTVEGTAAKTRRATGFEVLKVKVGGPDDLARLHAVRENTDARIRIDGNEGWTLETARDLMPELVRMGIEFVEQPLPAEDLDGYRALRELPERLPVIIDEGCKDLASVAPIAEYADGVNIKLAKAGGLREGLRMVHAARALGLEVMLGCMIESELGIALSAQLAPLVDYVDLDGHLLIEPASWRGLGLEDGRIVLSQAPGLGVEQVG